MARVARASTAIPDQGGVDPRVWRRPDRQQTVELREASFHVGFSAAIQKMLDRIFSREMEVHDSQHPDVEMSQEFKREINGPWVQVLREMVRSLIVYGIALVRVQKDDPEEEDEHPPRPFVLPLTRVDLEIKFRSDGPPIYRVFEREEASFELSFTRAYGRGGMRRPMDGVLVVEMNPPVETEGGRHGVRYQSVGNQLWPLLQLEKVAMRAAARAWQANAMPVLVTSRPVTKGDDSVARASVAYSGSAFHLQAQEANQRATISVRSAQQANQVMPASSALAAAASSDPTVMEQHGAEVHWEDQGHLPRAIETMDELVPPLVHLGEGRSVTATVSPREPGNLKDLLELILRSISQATGVPLQLLMPDRSQLLGTTHIMDQLFAETSRKYSDLVRKVAELFLEFCYADASDEEHASKRRKKEPTTDKPRFAVSMPMSVNIDDAKDLFDRRLIDGQMLKELVSSLTGIDKEFMHAPEWPPEPEVNPKPASGTKRPRAP